MIYFKKGQFFWNQSTSPEYRWVLYVNTTSSPRSNSKNESKKGIDNDVKIGVNNDINNV